MRIDESIHSVISNTCKHLETTAQDMEVTLKLDPASVPDLEEIIKALLDINADAETLNGCTFMVGVYLGEIIRKHVGGYWGRSIDNELVLTVGTTSYFPVATARKYASNRRLEDGLSFYVSHVIAAHTDLAQRVTLDFTFESQHRLERPACGLAF